MKKTLLSAVAFAALVTIPGMASAADDDGWYVRAGVGVGLMESMDLSGALNGTIKPAGDLRPTIGFGKYLANDWRLDFDVTQRYNDGGAINNTALNGVAKLHSWDLMANVIKDFDFGSRVTPYLGLGAGLASANISASGYQYGNVTDPYNSYDDSAKNFAWNALAGLTFEMSEKWDFDIGYRYFMIPDPEWGSSGQLRGSDYQSHDVFAQFRYNFGAKAEPAPPPPPPPPPPPAPKPQPAPPPPPPPPPPAPVCGDVAFPVYFAWDRSDLTQEARSAISESVNVANRCGVTSASVSGFTDTSGSKKYNMGLSQSRASIVRDELVRDGVNGSVISTAAFGETDLAVHTPDGVREPMNRRAQVVLRTSN